MNDTSSLVVADQREREVVWSALEVYAQAFEHEDETLAAITAVLTRVQQTFSWA